MSLPLNVPIFVDKKIIERRNPKSPLYNFISKYPVFEDELSQKKLFFMIDTTNTPVGYIFFSYEYISSSSRIDNYRANSFEIFESLIHKLEIYLGCGGIKLISFKSGKYNEELMILGYVEYINNLGDLYLNKQL